MKMIRKMKNIFIFIYVALLFVGCSDDNYGEHSDVVIPIPVLGDVPSEYNVGAEITITGHNFVAPNYVTLGDVALTVISETEGAIVVKLPRVFSRSALVVMNAFERTSQEVCYISPIYPDRESIKVTQWPTEIPRGQTITISGENVDLITELTIAGQNFPIDATTQSPGKLTVVIPADLSGNSSKIVARTVLNTYLESEEIPITEFDGEILLCDFEDGNLLTELGDMTGITYTLQDTRDGIVAEYGEHFFSYYAQGDIIGYWTYLGTIKIRRSIDLSLFEDPHLSFLYNSDDNVCNFQVGALQGVAMPAGDFKPELTGNELDDFMLHPTNGQWEWVSVRLVDFLVNAWASDTTPFNPQGMLDGFDFILKPLQASWWTGTAIGSAEVNKIFKINLDQVMITDGSKD